MPGPPSQAVRDDPKLAPPERFLQDSCQRQRQAQKCTWPDCGLEEERKNAPPLVAWWVRRTPVVLGKKEVGSEAIPPSGLLAPPISSASNSLALSTSLPGVQFPHLQDGHVYLPQQGWLSGGFNEVMDPK